MLEILDLGSRGIDCTIRVAKTRALINFAVTAKLICVFVFAYAKRQFSHDASHFFSDPTDAGIESLRVDGGVETQLPDKRYYGRPYGYGYAGFRK